MSDEVTYSDDDMVYVDPKKKLVIGKVEWTKDGVVKKKEMPADSAPEDFGDEDDDGKKKRKRKPKKRYYPACSYRTAKRSFHVEGKYKEGEEYGKFDDILKKALADPYWD